MTIHPTIRGCAIALLGVVGLCAFISIRYQAQLVDLIAFVTASQTEVLGVNWTNVRTSRNLAATVPALADELARARKAGIKPVLGVNVHSGDTAFHPPDWSPIDRSAPPGSSIAGGPVAAGAANPPTSPPLLVSAEAQGALVGLADGTIESRWKMFATLHRGDWSERQELDDVTADVAIDPAIEKAWRAATAPPSYRIDAFIGASIGINGLGIVGQVGGGRGRFGWFAGVDYVVADPTASRVGGGGRFTLR